MNADAGKIDLILTKSISRFARNTVDLLETVRHLREIGVEVWFETVVQLSKGNLQHKSVQVEFPLDDLDTSCLLNDATYKQI